jgi:hypothetical protein
MVSSLHVLPIPQPVMVQSEEEYQKWNPKENHQFSPRNCDSSGNSHDVMKGQDQSFQTNFDLKPRDIVWFSLVLTKAFPKVFKTNLQMPNTIISQNRLKSRGLNPCTRPISKYPDLGVNGK